MADAGMRVEPSDAADFIDEMGRVAHGLVPRALPGAVDSGSAGTHWTTGLFREGRLPDDRLVLADEREASSAVLAAVAAALEGLAHRMNTLPRRAREAFLGALPLDPRPARGEQAFITVSPTAGHLGTVVPAGTVLRAAIPGEDRPRAYTLTESVTVAPASIQRVVSHRRLDDGAQVLVDRAVDQATGRAVPPFPPFPRLDEPGLRSLRRSLFLTTPHLCAARAGCLLRVTFADAGTVHGRAVSTVPPALAAVEVSVTTAEGYRPLDDARWTIVNDHDVELSVVLPADVTARASPGGGGASEARRVGAGEVPAIRLRTPVVVPGTPLAEEVGHIAFLEFRDVSLSIESPADGLAADDLFANGTRVKPGAPFLPFGEPAHVEATFLIGCGAVLGLPLDALEVRFHAVGAATQIGEAFPVVPLPARDRGAAVAVPSVVWERREPAGWHRLEALDATTRSCIAESADGSLPVFGGWVVVTPSLPRAGACSATTRQGAATGHWLRLRLAHGDFGWAAHQAAGEAWTREMARRTAPVVSRLARVRAAVDAAFGFAPATASSAAVPPARPVSPQLTGVTLLFRSRPLQTGSGPGDVQVWRQVGPGDIEVFERAPMSSRFAPFLRTGPDWPGELHVGFSPLVAGTCLTFFVAVERGTSGAWSGEAVLRLEYYRGRTAGWALLPAAQLPEPIWEPGLLRFQVPDDWHPHHLPIEDDAGTVLCWLRVASSDPDIDLVVRRIAACAGIVTEELHGDESVAMGDRLPADFPLALASPISGVGGVRTTLAGWGGRADEPPAARLDRASRRTRHRQRAVSVWDVEHLLVDAMPELAQVRCLPHTLAGRADASGWLEVIVVPNGDGRLPRLNARQRDEVLAVLARVMPATARVVVRDASFVELGVRTTVRLAGGVSAVDARARIEARLQRWLHPRGSRGGRTQFGTRVTASSLRRHVAGLPDVREVVTLDFHGPHAGRRVVRPSGPDALIVSAPYHEIEVVP